MFICQCLPFFFFSHFLASPFFTFSFFACLLSFSFFLPSCFSCQLLDYVFSFCFVCFFFQDVICLESLYYILFGFASCLLVVVFLFSALIYCFLCFLATYQKTSLKHMEIPKTPKMRNAEKTDILTRAVSTVVFTNRVFCLFCVA